MQLLKNVQSDYHTPKTLKAQGSASFLHVVLQIGTNTFALNVQYVITGNLSNICKTNGGAHQSK